MASVSGHRAVCIRKHSVPSSMTSDKSLSTSTPKARVFANFQGSHGKGVQEADVVTAHQAPSVLMRGMVEGQGREEDSPDRLSTSGGEGENPHDKHTGGDHKSSTDCR